eukprot:TRINITY_DN3533_c0_g1_i1.p1 TRINITY_DN3533_c0_g1~~TRINITY_DN3533_c0_g1_i1.p1  ORF type:complete len:914 (+),score=178.51 TRINITY_DN3533_c0_g1_i1:151-2892(+)
MNVTHHPKRKNKLQKRTFFINLLELNLNFTIANQQNLNSGIQVNDPPFLIYNKWLDIDRLNNKKQYKKIYFDIMRYVISKFQIDIQQKRILFLMNDSRIPFKEAKQFNLEQQRIEEEKMQKKNEEIEEQKQERARNLQKLIFLEDRLRFKLKRKYLSIKKEMEKQRLRTNKQIGTLLKRSFIVRNGINYLVNVYYKENLYTFDLIYYFRQDIRRMQSKMNLEKFKKPDNTKSILQSNLKMKKFIQKIRGVYECDLGKLYNTKDKSMVDYLLSQLDVVSDTEIIFKEQKYDQLAIESDKVPPKNSVDQLILDQNEQQGPNFIVENSLLLTNQENVQGGNENSAVVQDSGMPNNIVSNLVDYQHKKDEQSGCDYIYNVVYTGKHPMLYLKTPRNNQGQISNLKDLQEESAQEKNTIKINVDLQEIKKLYPTIDTTQEGLMKQIGLQLIEGIKLDSKGYIIVDNNKINPNCIKVREKIIDLDFEKNNQNNQPNQKIQMPEKAGELLISEIGGEQQENQLQLKQSIQSNQISEQQMLSQQLQYQKTEKKTILLKNTQFYDNQKFLILIYEVERKVDKIIQQLKDSVFEEFEIIYQTSFINLSNKHCPSLVWEITPEELNGLSVSLKTSLERAQYLMKNIRVYSNKFIFIVEQKSDIAKILPKPNLLVLCQKGFLPIQMHFKFRKYKQNYKLYKNMLNDRSKDIILKTIPSEWMKQKQYIIIVGFNDKKTWHFIAWDIITYQRYNMEKDIDKVKYESYFEGKKESFIHIIQRHFTIDFLRFTLYLNESGLQEDLQKNFKDVNIKAEVKKQAKEKLQQQQISTAQLTQSSFQPQYQYKQQQNQQLEELTLQQSSRQIPQQTQEIKQTKQLQQESQIINPRHPFPRLSKTQQQFHSQAHKNTQLISANPNNMSTEQLKKD